MNNPIATYRFQLHKAFSFKELEAIIPYLQKLGIQTLYASPIFESTPGSTHGYDGLNPHRINPEIGTEADLLRIQSQLQEKGIGWLQDIVPNHMAYTPSNLWIWDVFQKGKRSVYASFFDIDWDNPVSPGQIMAPFLGESLEEVIQKGDLKVAYHNKQLVLVVNEMDFPLSTPSVGRVLEALPKAASLSKAFQQLERIEDDGLYGVTLVEQIWTPLAEQTELHADLEELLESWNKDPEKIQQLADEQYYRLCFYAETDTQINFRRFFTVNGLICLNIQQPEVFEHFHKYIQTLVDTGVFQGLRVDHIDGLYDPTAYLQQLRELAGPETYLTVEKILEPGEELPEYWPIEGNTGYDFLSYVNNLFTNTHSEQAFTEYYEKLTGDRTPILEQIHRKKAAILFDHMAGELTNLVRLYGQLDLPELAEEDLREAIAQWLIYCPVYRNYGNQWPLEPAEQEAIRAVFAAIEADQPKLKKTLTALQDTLFNQAESLPFYQRCMQFSGPLMAKGVEDTLLYTYHRFIGHNEVGDSVAEFGLSPEHFHQLMRDRQQKWPLSLNGTSTHDTKRGEDVRARLNVLTDLPQEWLKTVEEWSTGHRHAELDPSDQYFIFQTVLGAYPMPGQDEDEFPQRLNEYLQKALREAKLHSNWTKPNEAYEQAAQDFAGQLLDQEGEFWTAFEPFHRKIADWGIVNSLAQTLLKFAAPGVPDVYQGTESWDLSLVDPDNRRPVDYQLRQQWLDELDRVTVADLWKRRFTGQIKLWLTHQLFLKRGEHAETFAEGLYLPLQVTGAYGEHVLAFARRYQQNWFIVAVPLHAAQLGEKQKCSVLEIDWKDTQIVVPEEAPQTWLNLLGMPVESLRVQDLFHQLPVALLQGEPEMLDRNAGILLSVTSLPSNFGIGDLGPQAHAFVDALSRSKQSYWQLLPLNPTGVDQAYSPYSSISSRAGNPLLISPEKLLEHGWLKDLEPYQLPAQSQVDYEQVNELKTQMLAKAYQKFQQSASIYWRNAFREFCQQESEWLDDYALFVVLKNYQQQKSWSEWPQPYKMRESGTLIAFACEHEAELTYEKWVQFIFFQQWRELRAYGNQQNVQFLGDLPFYPSYDSVDVWANPEIFHLDEQGEMTCVAGVPPDYFNEEGQRWGMPLYRWDVLKARQYDWWIDRIEKNMELYDRLRLDHFRAFASYWEVPAEEKTAKNGAWKPGPGAEFFQVLQEKLGSLSLIAEDLGDIGEDVYQLRDEFMLPGMRVLHFAFSDDMPRSVNIPHNHLPLSLVYTGTHDNNTTKGWFRQDLSPEEHRNLEKYVGGSLSEETIHFVMIRLAYASVAQTAILPLQDVLGLDEKARMNTPAGNSACWKWRLLPEQFIAVHEKQLRTWAEIYHRG
ncbi:malto-oligosyltrehalose synthase [Siphonobacter sp.]|uniref:malto-oligosyltrehalose synthase n=1 Tax=Siphonobacter sp. TaxID=1869184 RepID=UPI003B3AF6A3